MDPHERARKLVALATDAGASSGEARSAAVAPCRLIAKHKLLAPAVGHASNGHAAHAAHATHGGHADTARRRSTRDHPSPEEATPRRRSRRDTRPEGQSYRPARPGTCSFCAKGFGAEDDVMTYMDGNVDHWHCAKRRAAGGDPARSEEHTS